MAAILFTGRRVKPMLVSPVPTPIRNGTPRLPITRNYIGISPTIDCRCAAIYRQVSPTNVNNIVRSKKNVFEITDIWRSICTNLNIPLRVNSWRPRRNRRHFADDNFKCIFFSENVFISIKCWLKFIPKGPISNIPALFQIMAWRRPGDKPLFEPMMIILLAHFAHTASLS